MIPRSREALKDVFVASAFMTMGLLMPQSLLQAGFEAHVGGIAMGMGIGWLIKSIIDHKKGVKREEAVE